MAVSFLTGFASPGDSPPTLKNFAVLLMPVHAAGANPETARNQPATERPARIYREMSAKLPKISPFRA
jgi:hypothetical protein